MANQKKKNAQFVQLARKNVIKLESWFMFSNEFSTLFPQIAITENAELTSITTSQPLNRQDQGWAFFF